MKRAPIIPKSVPSNVHVPPTTAPAAPMVDSLISRVSAMAKGNTIVIPICGREVRFTLETILGDDVEAKTLVWAGNERDQTLLNEGSLDDLIPSFIAMGQQNPAFGRKKKDVIEVADGSRRRKAAILTFSEYRVLVGDLDDEQMDSLCKIGNDYRPTSAYERGKRYSERLNKEFEGNISALSEVENISRKVITRCINTSKLPHAVMALFSHPGELSARAGELLYKNFAKDEQLMLSHADKLIAQKSVGFIFEADELLKSFNDLLKSHIERPAQPTKRQLAPGALAQYTDSKVVFTLDRTKLSEESIYQIEKILENASRNS